MKTLVNYILEALNINEGGNAVNGSPMTQKQTKEVFNDVVKTLLSKLGLTEDGKHYSVLGSFGKKNQDQTSGDIDIAYSIETVAGYLGISIDMVPEAICDIIKDKYYVYNKGTKIISISWPIPGTNLFGQVDLMPSDNMDYSKWMYHSPDFTKAESKYKGAYRNQLLMSIIHFAKKNILSKTEKDEIIDFERYSLRLAQGVYNTTRTFRGKRKDKDGNMILKKNDSKINELDKFITNTPEEIIKIAFGDNVKRSQTMNFEDVYKLFMSKNFKHKDKRNEIITKFIHDIKQNNLPIPSEVMEDWSEVVEHENKDK